MYNIDARGRSCPEPVLMTKEVMDENQHDEIRVVVDLYVAVENISRFAKGRGCTVSVSENGDEYEILIKK